MQRQLKSAAVESLCVDSSDNEDIFISERLLPTASVSSNIYNYEGKNAAWWNYSSNGKATLTSSTENLEWYYKEYSTLT